MIKSKEKNPKNPDDLIIAERMRETLEKLTKSDDGSNNGLKFSCEKEFKMPIDDPEYEE